MPEATNHRSKSSKSSTRQSFETEALIEVDNLSFSYDLGKTDTLKEINLDIPKNKVTSFIGPSGCGKSTLLRCFNRMNDPIETAKITGGTVRIKGVDLYKPRLDPVLLRKEVGMVLQKSDPFPKSIYENVAFGLRISGERKRSLLDQAVEESLKAAALWDDVKDRLKEPATGLSEGQQQRLCIARTIAVKPGVLLLDEPCAALDLAATLSIEALITKLREEYTIVVVTHNMQQATRISDHTAFFYRGELVEYDMTSKLFTNPSNPKTEAYISGRFG